MTPVRMLIAIAAASGAVSVASPSRIAAPPTVAVELAAQMAGPGVAHRLPPGDPTDRDQDGDVDMEDFRLLQLFGGQETDIGPLALNPCFFSRSHSGVGRALKGVPVTGASARIQIKGTILCGEPTHTALAASAAWTGVHFQTELAIERFSQVGYARHRGMIPPTPSSQFHFRIYAENKYGPGEFARHFFSPAIPNPGGPFANAQYITWITSPLAGAWGYEQEGFEFHSFSHPNWSNETGNSHSYYARYLT